MSDLWDFGVDEPDVELSDSGDEVQDVSDTDFLLPDSKRRKLQQRFQGKRTAGGSAVGGRRGQQKQEVDGGDSDIDLLNSSPDSSKVAALPQPVPQPAAATARRPKLDAKSSSLLQQLKATQAAMRAAAQEIDLTEEDTGSGAASLEPSPVQLRHSTRWARGALQQQQGGGSATQQEDEDEEEDFCEILEDSLLPAAGAAGSVHPPAAPAEKKIPLKLQSVHGVTVLQMRKTDPFEKLFNVYRQHAVSKGWVASADAAVKFIFDGDMLMPDDTPEGQDLEGDEMIEVRF